MGTKKKTVLKGFDYLHCDDFAAYLMQMARKGWHFKEWGAGLVFEKGAPEEAVYSVEVFIDGSEYDTRPGVHTQEFAEYCEAAGWKLIDAKRKFCIFKQVKPDAIEILTPEERLQNIAREEQKRIWLQLFLGTWFMVLQFLQFTGSGFVNRIFSNPILFITVLWCILWLGALGRCIHFYIWKGLSGKKMENGEAVHFGKGNDLFSFMNGWYSWVCIAALIVYVILSVSAKQYLPLVYVVLMLVPLIVMAYFISKFRPDALTNQIIQIVVPMLMFVLVMTFFVGTILTDKTDQVPLDEIPLLYEDIGGVAGLLEESNLDGSSSIYGSGLRCWLYYEEEHIYYQVYKSDHRWILDKIWNDEMERKYNQLGTDVTSLWDAEIAIRNVPGDYLVRYPDAVLILSFAEDTVLSSEHVQTVRTALLESR